jgi:hypothetical protein
VEASVRSALQGMATKLAIIPPHPHSRMFMLSAHSVAPRLAQPATAIDPATEGPRSCARYQCVIYVSPAAEHIHRAASEVWVCERS